MTTSNAFADLSNACRDAAARLQPSVVQIQGRPRHPATALAVAPERLVTTSHSVEWDEQVHVWHEGRQLSGAVAGRDVATDLVLLNVPGLKAPAVGFSPRTPGTGELALIVGRSWGGYLKARLTTVTVVEGPVRVGRGRTVQNVLHVDTTPYTGFSGSGVLLPDGTLAGITTTGLVRGVGMAVGAETAKTTIEALERDGSIRRGYLGITSQPLTVPAAQRQAGVEHGLLVVGIAEEAPAATAGVLVGDILVAFDGRPVADPEQLLTRLSGDRIGQAVTLRVIRGRDLIEVPVTVGERPGRS